MAAVPKIISFSNEVSPKVIRDIIEGYQAEERGSPELVQVNPKDIGDGYLPTFVDGVKIEVTTVADPKKARVVPKGWKGLVH